MDEKLRLFLINLVEFQASKDLRKSEELNPGIVNEGFAGSFEDSLMHLFYKLALVDGFHGLTEENADKKDLQFLARQYELCWKAIFDEMEDLDFKASFLRAVPEKARFFINEYQLPRVDYQDEMGDMKYFGNEVETATKYLNFSLSLAIYAYYSYKHEFTDLAWMCLMKAREMYAFFAAVRVFAFSSANGRAGFKKTKARSPETYNSLIPFLLLELKNPSTEAGWPSLKESVPILVKRLLTQANRYKHFDISDSELKNDLTSAVRRWLTEDKLLKNVYEEFSASPNQENLGIKLGLYTGAKRHDFDEITAKLLMEPFSPNKYVQPSQIFKKGDKVVTLSAEDHQDLTKDLATLRAKLSYCEIESTRLKDNFSRIPFEIVLQYSLNSHRIPSLRESRKKRLMKRHLNSRRLRESVLKAR